jgi:hypothetical protein
MPNFAPVHEHAVEPTVIVCHNGNYCEMDSSPSLETVTQPKPAKLPVITSPVSAMPLKSHNGNNAQLVTSPGVKGDSTIH